MQKTLKDWVDVLVQADLPVLEQTRQALRTLEKSPEVAGVQITAATLPDPMMVLKVMRMVNSGRVSGFSQPILTIEHAMMMNGLSASFMKMLSCPVLDEAAGPVTRAGLMTTAARACHAAYQARDWASMRLDMNVEEVYIAALMQELGEMALWSSAPEQMQALLKRRREVGAELAEQELFGFSLDELTLALAVAWNLPPLIASALRPADCELHPRARMVGVARRLARHAERGWHDEPVLQEVAALAEILRISPDDAAVRIHRTAVAAARHRPFAGVAPAATWLPMLPGPWPEEVEPAAVDPFGAVMAGIASHLDGTLHLNELMKLVFKGMRDCIGLKRVVFALLTQDRSQLRARFVVGAPEHAPLRQFQFDVRLPTLFGRMMGRQQAFWLNDEVRPKVEGLLDDEIRRTTAVSQFFVMTVAVHGKVIGMFYADRDDAALDADAYGKFKQLCTQASLGMAHLSR
ncbi:HDOD domain protein [mine drainage metagenome]|uniref:HDOD domain protein n=1 Tax=mine drainage metagenome TaxID=410659 RepID=A0A1J5QPG6_9ZZZZ